MSLNVNLTSNRTDLLSALTFDGPSCDLLTALPIAVLLVDNQGAIYYRNPASLQLLTDGNSLAKAITVVRLFDQVDWVEVLRRVIIDGETVQFDGAIQSTANMMAMTTIRVIPVKFMTAESPSAALVVFDERSNQELSEADFDANQRLTSLGKLASRVAHELNNPLDGILRYINLALRVVDDGGDEKIKKYLTESRTGLKRMVQIIGDLLEFSRNTSEPFDESDVNEVVEQAIKAQTASMDDSGIVITGDYQQAIMPMVSGSRLYQVCGNLIKNAIDVMPTGGRLSVTTSVIQDEVIIRVADTGPGLPQPIEKIFEPFFTTKESGRGTGLGLAICKDFVEEMKGVIEATNGENGGAVFTVRIPLASFRKA